MRDESCLNGSYAGDSAWREWFAMCAVERCGNFQDASMKRLASAGNGNYAYLESVLEAKKVMVSEFGGTLFTVAKDVKVEIEFNPAQVSAYRLLGYELVGRLQQPALDFSATVHFADRKML